MTQDSSAGLVHLIYMDNSGKALGLVMIPAGIFLLPPIASLAMNAFGAAPFMGWLFDRTGSYDLGILIMTAGFTLSCLTFMVLLARPKPTEAAH